MGLTKQEHYDPTPKNCTKRMLRISQREEL